MSGIIGGKSLFERTQDASSKYNEAKARETLETVLLTVGQFDKRDNPKYNQDDFLNELIKREIPGSNVKGDVAIIGGEYAYDLDRSVPKIGTKGNNGYVGNPKDLIWPDVKATFQLATDNKSATIRVTAKEEKNGINKIEIWFAGEKIETLTKTYDNIKTEITDNFTVNKNGTYTVKAYGDLMGSTTVEIIGVVPAVEFSPNGSTEYKKQHSTKITVKETGEKVTSLKYVWTTSGANKPAINNFTDTVPDNNTIIGGDDTMTGTYYLWVLLTTETGKTSICGSEGFYFDNEGPTVATLTSSPTSDTSFTLTATASDTKSGIDSYKFYIDGKEYTPNSISNGVATYTWNGTAMRENVQASVTVLDSAGNSNSKTITDARTKLYTWLQHENTTTDNYELVKDGGVVSSTVILEQNVTYARITSVRIDSTTGNVYPTASGSFVATTEDSSNLRGFHSRDWAYPNVYIASTSTPLPGNLNEILSASYNRQWSSWKHEYNVRVQMWKKENKKKDAIRSCDWSN